MTKEKAINTTFCDIGIFEVNKISELLKPLIDIGDEIELIYDSWRNDFEATLENKKNANGYYLFHNKHINKKINNSLKLGSKESSFNCVGIDLPTLFTRKGNKECIIIVGRDPQRTMSDWAKYFKSTELNCGNSFILGSPYSQHSYENRFENGDARYWEFISLILTKYNVYLTDIYKIFARNSKSQSFTWPPFTELKAKIGDNPSIHEKLLIDEFVLLEQNMKIKGIIAQGRDSGKFLLPNITSKLSGFTKKGIMQDKFNGMRSICIPHISPSGWDINRISFINKNLGLDLKNNIDIKEQCNYLAKIVLQHFED